MIIAKKKEVSSALRIQSKSQIRENMVIFLGYSDHFLGGLAISRFWLGYSCIYYIITVCYWHIYGCFHIPVMELLPWDISKGFGVAADRP
jgi:hypothetical protein